VTGFSPNALLKFIFKNSRKLFFQKIFDAVSFLQVVVYHPLLDLSFPANVKIINEQLIDIATYDVLPTDDLFPPVFNLNTTEMVPLNERYNEFRFETKNLLLNMGSLFCIFLFTIFQFMVLGITSIKCIRDHRHVAKVRRAVTGDLVWSSVITFFFAAYSEILFSVLLHSGGITWTDSKAHWFSNVMYYLFAALVVFLPLWTIIFLTTRYKRLHEEYY